MYESYFGLTQRPFAAAPVVERFFPASSIDAARQALARCIERAEGVGACIAAAGMGKTLLLEVLADQFSESFGTVLLAAGAWASRRELLQAICFELKIPYQGLDEGELRLALVNQLTRTDKYRRGIVLLVDEAHTLGVPLLEELRVLSNLVHAGEPRVRLVIAGSLRLEELLAAPQLESFSQRLVCRTYLEPFDRAETIDYVRFQIAVAGGRVEQVFEPAAVDAVYRATDGVPRLVNQLCDHALLMAYSQEQRPVAAHWIEKAWADLQQLPVPWQEPPAATAASGNTSSVIEFGALSDDLDDFQPQAAVEFGSAAANESQAVEAESAAHEAVSPLLPDGTRMEDAHADVPPSKAMANQPAEAVEAAGEGEDGAWGMHDEHDDTLRRAEARFEELAAQFEALQAEDLEASEEPFAAQYTEAELSFDDEDPFDEFDEEEPLIDPYAASARKTWLGDAQAPDAATVANESCAAGECEAEQLQAEPLHEETPVAEQPVEEPVADEPAADDEDEEPWEAVEEWSVHDSYRESGTTPMPEILSITPLPRQTAFNPPVQPWDQTHQPELARDLSEVDQPVLDSPEGMLAEVVIDPYAGLAELGERLRQEALRLTESQQQTAETHEEAAVVDSAEDNAAVVQDQDAETPGDEPEPVAGRIEHGQVATATEEAASPASSPANDVIAEEPVELRQGKLTLAEAIRRRKEASAAAAAHARPVANDEPTVQPPHHQPQAAAETHEHEETWSSDMVNGATIEADSAPPDEQVVIVLDETIGAEQAALDDAPRVRREDYRTLFERLRRG